MPLDDTLNSSSAGAPPPGAGPSSQHTNSHSLQPGEFNTAGAHLSASSLVANQGSAPSIPSSPSTSASPGASPTLASSVTLERSASVLARQIAMAKLTGSAPPTPPQAYLTPTSPHPLPFGNAPPPSLEELQARVQQKLDAAGPGDEQLKRTGSSRSHASETQQASTPTSLNPEAGAAAVDDDVPLTRADARVNLMRKLSSRRLESPRAMQPPSSNGADSAAGSQGLERSNSNGGGSGSFPVEAAPPLPSLPLPTTTTTAPTPSISQHGGSISESSDGADSIVELSSMFPPSTLSPNNGAGRVPPFRRGSIPQHVFPGPPRSMGPPPPPAIALGASDSGDETFSPSHKQIPTFGPGAVEGDFDVRRRGSSASSSVAFLEAHGRVHRGSTVGSLGGESGPLLTLGSASGSGSAIGRRGSSLGLSPGNEPSSWLDPGGSEGYSSVSNVSPTSVVGTPIGSVAEEDKQVAEEEKKKAQRLADSEWELKQQRLVAKVERKREAGLQRSKEGAFPPPEEGYQFPSPVMSSPRQSDEQRREIKEELISKPALASPTSPPKGLFGAQTALPSTPPPRQRHRSPFAPSYLPLGLPAGAVPPPLVPPPLSPTSLEPAGATSFFDMVASSSQPLQRLGSAESASKQRARFGAAIVNGAKGPVNGSPMLNSPPTLGSGGGEALTRSESNQSARSVKAGPVAGLLEEELKSTPGSPASFHSLGSSNASRRRDRSSSEDSLELPTRFTNLPQAELPASKILTQLDSLLDTRADDVEAEVDLSAPSALDSPPRRLLLHTPVLQVVNAHTVKDRYLFLFTDLLLITKPIIEDDPATGLPMPASLDSSFVVKSVVELKHLNLPTTDEGEPGSSPSGGSSSSAEKQKKHPLLVAFVDRFANDPKRAIASLIQKGGLSNDGPTIARLLFANPDLNRNQVGAYLSQPANRHILRAFIERFRFSGVRIDDALRMFMMTMRLPHNLEAVEYVLGVLASQWTEINGNSGFDPTLTLSLVLAIMKLSDALHSGMHAEEGLFSFPNGAITVDDFVAAFRERDTRMLVQEDLLTRIYASVRKERIEQASDNSIFSMTPDIEAAIEPAKLPDALTYRTPSEPITITIPEPDAKFTIKLHGTDLKFDPPVLSFAKSNTQSFRVTGLALGVRAMVLIKTGANAPRYQGLPINKAFSIERAFMQNTFQINFINHLDLKRKYMFSTLDGPVRAAWLKQLKERRKAELAVPPPTTRSRQAAEQVAVQVLRDVLIVSEEPAPSLNSAAPSPRPNTAAPRFVSSTPVPGSAKARLGTPTRTAAASGGAGALVRSNSSSRLYPAGPGKAENELGPNGKPLPAGQQAPSLSLSAGTPRGSPGKEGLSEAAAAHAKSGHEIATTAEQNSLLPLVLGFLELGIKAAPEPMSMAGSAFQLPPLEALELQG